MSWKNAECFSWNRPRDGHAGRRITLGSGDEIRLRARRRLRFGSAAVAAPALDRAADDAFFVAALAPQPREARVGRGRALFRLEVVEPHSERDGDALAAHDALAVAQRRDCVEEATRAFWHRG